MTQHKVYTGNGYVTYSTADLVFEFEGKECFMEFHRYCGPFFYFKRSQEEMDEVYNTTGKILSEEIMIEADDSPRYDKLWDAFNKWMETKDEM